MNAWNQVTPVILVLTAPILMDPSNVHVTLDTLEMDSIVQVRA